MELKKDSIMEFDALGCSAFNASTFYAPIWNLDSGECFLASWTVGSKKASYVESPFFCNVVALESYGDVLISLSQQGNETLVHSFSVPFQKASLIANLGHVDNISQASIIDNGVFWFVSGNSEGTEWILNGVDVASGKTRSHSLGDAMIVGIA